MTSFLGRFNRRPRSRGRCARKRVRRSAVLLTLLSLPVACGNDTEPRPGQESPPTEDRPTADSIRFLTAGTLTLAPSDEARLEVVVEPAGVHTVRFALLPDRPNEKPNDGSLDRAEVLTDESGRASVLLTAPSAPSAFAVRASVDEVDARLPVSVSDKGYARLQLAPSYQGARAIDSWVASIRAGTTCSELGGFPPPDGALVATSSGDEGPLVHNVPVGPVIAVGVRAGQYAYGCANVTDLANEEERVVAIQVADRPLVLGGTLALDLGVDETTKEWTAVLEGAITESLAAFRGESTDDAALLLSEMETQIGSATARDEFANYRITGNFDSIVLDALATPTQLRGRASAWLTEGASTLDAPDTFRGELDLSGSSGLFVLKSAGGVEADSSGFLGSATWTAQADLSDTIVLGGALLFQPTRWVTALADSAASGEYPDATGVASALAELLDCKTIGGELVDAAGGELYSGCNADCAEGLCEAALVSAWARAGNASSLLKSLNVGVTGAAEVDDEARPVALDGTWVGTLAGPASAVGGVATATTPEP